MVRSLNKLNFAPVLLLGFVLLAPPASAYLAEPGYVPLRRTLPSAIDLMETSLYWMQDLAGIVRDETLRQRAQCVNLSNPPIGRPVGSGIAGHVARDVGQAEPPIGLEHFGSHFHRDARPVFRNVGGFEEGARDLPAANLPDGFQDRITFARRDEIRQGLAD